MTLPHEDEPTFLVLDYVTITRDPKTALVVAIGGDQRAAGLLQTDGGFHSAPSPLGDYHRLPHALPVEEQRQGATAAAHALLLAGGYSVHLDPTLNTLATQGSDRQAAHRHLEQLTSLGSDADNDRQVAAVLTEIAAPDDGLLPRLTQSLLATWASWGRRLKDTGRDPQVAMQLGVIVNKLSTLTWQIEQVRNDVDRTGPAPQTHPRPVSTAPSPLAAPAVRQR
ncbi:hypothetical protein [Streptomyces sp. NBC_00258]|uniref:hypothetical protein n=1 Tax=Streptomyces sp. NBC_00258 TaxID=2903642 RepID=UPI002E2D1C11|nr:hypothetical protein [Streptomyces sp. NBC_00258]